VALGQRWGTLKLNGRLLSGKRHNALNGEKWAISDWQLSAADGMKVATVTKSAG